MIVITGFQTHSKGLSYPSSGGGVHTLVSQVHAVLQDADPYVELQIDDEMRLDQVELRAFVTPPRKRFTRVKSACATLMGRKILST